MSNSPTADKPCLKCGITTKQTLVPSEFGCDWQCSVCNNTLHAYAFKDMLSLVRKHVFKLPETTVPVAVPADLKVFIKSTVPEYVELELSTFSIQQHIEVTGQLPQVGKTMFANRDGMPVPYGEVTRLEHA